MLSQFSNSKLGSLQYYHTGLLQFKEEQGSPKVEVGFC